MKYALRVLAGVNHLPHYESTRSSHEKSGRGRLLPFLRVCERPNVRDVCSPWGDVTLVTEGSETARPEARTKKAVECSTAFFVRAKGLEPIRTKAPDPKSGLATNYNTLAKPFGRLITLSPSLKSAFWKLPTSVSERITKLCIFFKNPKQPASGHPQKQSLT